MTRMPKTLPVSAPLEEALMLMRQQGFRHVPVEEAGKLVGVLSDRAVKSAAASGWAKKLTVGDVMIGDPFTTSTDTPLDAVASVMAEEKFGCAILCDDAGKVEGIFTTVDACRALRQLLETVYPE
jgi:acetoin utilization protein AcuB